MSAKELKWKGCDASLSVCINDYGKVYTYDGEDFFGYVVDGVDNNCNPISFAPFSIDNRCIDDYFDDEGDEIAKMCGVDIDVMDYEWKMDALFDYYGSMEFIDSVYTRLSKKEVIELIKDNWQGNCDIECID